MKIIKKNKSILRIVILLLGISLGLLGLTVSSGAAFAQNSGYPGSTTSTTPTPQNLTVNLGVFTSGQSKTVQSCGFQANSSVSATLNQSTSLGSLTSDSNGCVSLTFSVTSVNSAGGTISLGGKSYNVALTGNTITYSGTGQNGAGLTVTNNFSLSNSSSGQLAFTGFDAVKWGLVIFVLLVIGATLIVFERKRSAKHA